MSELPKYYANNPNAENDVGLDWHYFKVRMDPDQKIQYVYVPVRQLKQCVCIEMLYVTSSDIYYLRLILLNRKARSDNDVLTYTHLFVVEVNQLFVGATSNLQLLTVMLIVLLT